MIDPETLAFLRCPIDPQRTTGLVLEDEHKVFCARCRVQFPTRDGIINLIVEEAILPEGCSKRSQLPCQQVS